VSKKPKIPRSSDEHWTKDPNSSRSNKQGLDSDKGKQWYRTGKLSQYGRNGSYNQVPRWDTEQELSMFQGVVDADQAWRLMVGGKKVAPKGSEMRVFEAEALVAAEYWVWESPTSFNHLHASVGAPIASTDRQEHEAWWNNPERKPLKDLQEEVSDAIH
jgi:hypothetical protein